MIYQAESPCGLRVNNLAGQNHFHGLAFAQQPSQTLGTAATGYDAKVDFGLPKGSLLTGHANVASQGYLATATQTISIDHGDDRFRKTVDRIEQGRFQHHFALRNRGPLGEFGDVRAGNKCLIAGAGKYDDANGIVPTQIIKDRGALGTGLDVKGVPFFRPVDSNNGDRSAAFKQNSLVTLAHFACSRFS
jgi:hypothetical protein